MQSVVSSTLDNLVQLGEIELSFYWLNHLPCYAAKNSVYVGCFQLWSYLIHVLGGCKRRVLQLSCEHEIGFAIDDELMRRPGALKTRNSGSGRHGCTKWSVSGIIMMGSEFVKIIKASRFQTFASRMLLSVNIPPKRMVCDVYVMCRRLGSPRDNPSLKC
jgi:hypothetical protein